jgi:predicted NBD/HSP70 family sugar kinase
MSTATTPVRARDARWSAASDALRELRGQPDLTRAELARRLRLSSGTATGLLARLRDLRLLSESPAPVEGRGRPTTVIGPHPDGPVVLAVEVRTGGWRCGVAGLDGEYREVAAGPHGTDPRAVIRPLRAALVQGRHRYGDRVRATSVSVTGTVSGTRLVQAEVLGWESVDLAPLAVFGPLLVGNDATLAGLAEARRGAARGARTALHVLMDVGIGGALTVDGAPVTGRRGAAGEFGHLPFADPAVRCPCGARGCWETAVDGRALARILGDPVRYAGHAYTLDVLARTDPVSRRAVATSAAAFGRGIAGLINAYDPDVVTIGDLAPRLVEAAPEAFERGLRSGMMRLHRADPPPIRPALLGGHGGLSGAIEIGLDHITDPSALDIWSTAASLSSA